MPKGDNAGRKKGIPNKATIEFKEAVTNLLNYATPHMVEWMQRIAIDDPHKALEHVHKFAQFSHPLLARAEHTGADGKELKITIVQGLGDDKHHNPE